MSETDEKKPVEKVRFLYSKPDDYKMIYANGAYGGITPRGDLICNFFLEYNDLPLEEVAPLVGGRVEADKIQRVDRVEHKPTELVIRRDLKVGIIIPVHQISTIANWMLDKLKSVPVVMEKKE